MAAEAMAQKTNVPEIQDAIVRIRTLSADEKARELAYQRELALHEKATWEKNLKKAEEKTREAEEKIKWADEKIKNADEKIKNADEKMKNADEKMKNADEKMKEADEKLKKAADELRKNGVSEERIAEILNNI